MKDIIKVSISGIAFILDDEAFQTLDNYLNKLGDSYRNNPDGGEIIADIEARIAEIILSKQNCDTLIGDTLIRSIIEQLGVPEELTDADGVGKTEDYSTRTLKAFPRRLYRNPDGAKLGGVCSGLGTFFDVDAVWIRLGFFAPLILLIVTSTLHVSFLSSFLGATFGALFFSYLILWFAIPLAKTPRQRLEMRGEKITASSIHNNFKEDFSQMSGDSPKGQKSASVLAELVYVFGRVLLFGVKVVALLIGFGLAMGAIALLVAFFALMFGSSQGSIEGMTQLLVIDGMSTQIFIALLAMVAFAPMAILTYLLLRLVFNLPANRTVLYIIFGLWLVLTVYVGYVATNNFDNIKHSIEMADNDFDDMDDFDDPCQADATVITEGIIEGDSTRTDSVVISTSIPQLTR